MKPSFIAVIAIGVFLSVILIAYGKKADIKELNKMPSLIMWKIIYTDIHTENKKNDVVYSKILHSQKYDIQGKPDYIYRHRISGEIMPVEIKSGEVNDVHDGDILQIGAYMLIVQELYKRKPHKALLCYKNKCFYVKNNKSLKKNVINTAERMRKMLKTGIEEPNASFANCRHCVCNGTVCEFSETSYIWEE